MKKYYSDETKNQTVQEFINGKRVSKYMLKPKYQEVLYILGLNLKKNLSLKPKKSISGIIVNL